MTSLKETPVKQVIQNSETLGEIATKLIDNNPQWKDGPVIAKVKHDKADNYILSINGRKSQNYTHEVLAETINIISKEFPKINLSYEIESPYEL